MKISVLTIFTFALFVYSFAQDTLKVPSEYGSIQHAINSSTQGDVVLVAPGTYLEKPVDPHNYVRSIQRTLGVELSPEKTERAGLRDEVEQSLRGATADQLRNALAALKKAGRS